MFQNKTQLFLFLFNIERPSNTLYKSRISPLLMTKDPREGSQTILNVGLHISLRMEQY